LAKKKSETLIGKIKHHLLCQSRKNKRSWSFKQKSFLERQTFVADKKAVIFEMMIDIAEEEYKIDIRKNSPPEQSTILNTKNSKQ
jgi:hypothetical protein